MDVSQSDRSSWFRCVVIGICILQASGSFADDNLEDLIAIPNSANPTRVIDLLVESKWLELEVKGQAVCGDETFVRRIYLDLVGRIPTPSERTDFLLQTSRDKREQLVDNLLASPEFGRHFADVFDVVLMGRGSQSQMSQRQQHGWRSYLEESFNANRPWNHMARDMTLARKADDTDVRAGWFLYERKDNHQAIAETVSPAFFGLRIECAQCHDHPLAEEIAQAHYWGLVSFFQRSKNENTSNGPRVAEGATGAFNKFTNIEGESYETELTFFASTTIPEARPANGGDDKKVDESTLYVNAAKNEPKVPKFSRREVFVQEVLLDHPLLAKAYVNRIWALLVGRGFVHPVDRMDSTHEASHPNLLNWLAGDLTRSGFDTKRLVKAIVMSQAYQLAPSSDPQVLPETFSFGIEKPLTAETLLRSMYVAFDSTKQEPDATLLADFRRKFADVFAEEFTSNASQTLYLTNNPRFNEALNKSNLVDVLKQEGDMSQRVKTAFETVLGRSPDADEQIAAEAFLKNGGESSRESALVWVLVTGAEFRFNR